MLLRYTTWLFRISADRNDKIGMHSMRYAVIATGHSASSLLFQPGVHAGLNDRRHFDPFIWAGSTRLRSRSHPLRRQCLPVARTAKKAVSVLPIPDGRGDATSRILFTRCAFLSWIQLKRAAGRQRARGSCSHVSSLSRACVWRARGCFEHSGRRARIAGDSRCSSVRVSM